MSALLIWTVNLALIANGAFMLLWPETWYGFVPGVVDTGPFNPHFVRDIGSAYLVAGGSLLWFTLEKRARPAAIAAAAFLALHAVVHLWDAVAGREALVQLLEDVPIVILPAALIFKVARPRRRSPKETSDAEMAHAAADRRL
jgi:hypothetical protein